MEMDTCHIRMLEVEQKLKGKILVINIYVKKENDLNEINIISHGTRKTTTPKFNTKKEIIRFTGDKNKIDTRSI